MDIDRATWTWLAGRDPEELAQALRHCPQDGDAIVPCLAAGGTPQPVRRREVEAVLAYLREREERENRIMLAASLTVLAAGAVLIALGAMLTLFLHTVA